MPLTTDLWRALMPGCDGMAEMVDVFLAEVERQGATVTRGPTFDSEVTIEGPFILSFALSDAYSHRIKAAGVKDATPEGEALAARKRAEFERVVRGLAPPADNSREGDR